MFWSVEGFKKLTYNSPWIAVLTWTEEEKTKDKTKEEESKKTQGWRRYRLVETASQELFLINVFIKLSFVC